MITVKELYDRLDDMIPKSLSCEWDNDGLMLSPDTGAEVRRVAVALDVTDDTVAFAKDYGAELIVTHHPLIFKPLKRLVSHKLITLISSGISVFSFHTRLDVLETGVNSALAASLSLKDVRALNCELGLIGEAHSEMTVNEYADFVCRSLGTSSVRFIPSNKHVKKVAVIGGAGKDYIRDAIKAGADVFITGEAGYHGICDAADCGMYVIEAGHYETENPVCETLKKMIEQICPELDVVSFNSGQICTHCITN